MKDVFISYRRDFGKEYAEKLYAYLNEKSRGLRVYYDKVDMKDGKTFPPQLESAVREAPNYVLIATQNVFTHGKEERDWVWKEIEIALDEYKKNPLERTLTVLVPSGVEIPAREALPDEIQDIADVQRIGERTDTIELPFGHDWNEEFHRVFLAVTELNRRNLWYAAHRWYENSCREGGRFSSLRIDETIMPFTSESMPHAELPIRVFVGDKKTETKPLLNALSSSDGHLYLIGQGGIGKTTALMHIMNQAYDKKAYAENAQIPIFVDLSYAPDSASGQIYANGKSTFIRRAIFRQVRAERSFRSFGDAEVETLTDLFGLPYDLAVRPIVDLLRHESPAPEYLLLLDGLNEVSTQTIEATLDDGGKTRATVYGMIREEIIWLIENCPNVRIVLTSRADESAIYENITKLYLSEIDETAALDYLRSIEIDGKKIGDAEIEGISNDSELMRVLRVPLFLTIYASLRDKNEATAAGEILRVFFNERRRGLPDQTVKDHLAKIEKNVNSDSAGFLEGRITADMYDFILDFILPEISWHLERKGEFLFSAREIRNIIMPILNDRDDLAICGDYGQEAFTAFCLSNPEDNTTTAEKLLGLANDESKANRMILGICVNVLGILHFADNKYGFVHQHIRDYFAAVKNVNTMRLAVYMFEEGEKELAVECMNNVFRDEPISMSVRRFMGEYLGEHKNKPYFANEKWNCGVAKEDCDRNLINRTIVFYRHKYDCLSQNGYTLYSLVQILKEVRMDLSGCDFSDLDLTELSLYGTLLARPGLTANFRNSKINMQTVFPYGHSGRVVSASFSSNNQAVLTNSSDNTVILWDTLIGRVKKTLVEHSEKEIVACIHPAGTLVMVSSEDGYMQFWNEEEKRWIKTIRDSSGGISSACFSPDGNILATVSKRRNIKLWSMNSYKQCGMLKSKTAHINDICFSPDGKKIAIVSDGTIIKILNSTTGLEIATLPRQKYNLRRVWFSDDGNKLIILDSSSVREWDINTCNVQMIFDETLVSQSFIGISPNNKLIATSDYNNVFIWDVNCKKCTAELKGNAIGISAACISPDKEKLLVMGYNGIATLWDVKSQMEIGCFVGDAGWINKVSFNSDNKTCVSSYYRKKKQLWEVATGRNLGIINNWDTFAGYSTSGDKYITAYYDGSAKIWETESGKEIAGLHAHSDAILDAAFSPNGKRLATASSDETVIIWDTKDYENYKVLKEHSNWVCCVHFFYDSKNLITASGDGTAIIWDVEKSEVLGKISKNEMLRSASFSPKGKKILTVTFDGEVNIWNRDSYHSIIQLQMASAADLDDDICSRIGFNCNEDKAIIVSDSHTVTIFDAETGMVIGVLREDMDSICFAAFCSSDTEIIVITHGGILRIWSAETLECKKSIRILEGIVVCGCDFRNLHSDSFFLSGEKDILRQHGAIID